MKNRFVSLMVIALPITALLIYCAGGRGGNSESSVQVIGRVILLPDSTGVAGATVRTEPMSSFMETYSDGSFQMSDGLLEGRYTFIAQYKGIEGKSSIELQPSNQNFVIIMLGKEIDMKDWEAQKKATGTRGTTRQITTYTR